MRRRVPGLSTALATLVLAACASSGSSVPSVSSTADQPTVTQATTSTSVSPATTTTTTRAIAAPVETIRQVVTVPSGQPAVIDGVLGEHEWDDALVFEMSDGATLQLMHSAETLYVAVAGTEIGAVNVLIGTSDAIMILHSSAALGSARYKPASDEWELTHGFGWCCRDRTDDTARLDLLDEEGWQANIGFTGDPGIVEYQITLPWHGAAMAVSSIRDDDDTGFWPLELSAAAREHLLGAPPDSRSYETGDWYTIEPASD